MKEKLWIVDFQHTVGKDRIVCRAACVLGKNIGIADDDAAGLLEAVWGDPFGEPEPDLFPELAPADQACVF